MPTINKEQLAQDCWYGFPIDYNKNSTKIQALVFHIEDRYINADIKELKEEVSKLELKLSRAESKLSKINIILGDN